MTAMPSVANAYDAGFFAEQVEGSRRAARVVLGLVRRLIGLRDVLDVGCGTGAWMAVAEELGARRAIGLDGPHVPAEARLLPPERYVEHDLARPFELGRRFDLALCLEVAEHLPIEAAPGLVRSLTRHAPAVLFSAALPYQGGTGHIAETWLEFWAELFAAEGFRGVDAIRPQIWRDRAVPWWYRQNTVLFVARRRLWRHPALWRLPEPVSQVHPELYLWAMRRPRPERQRNLAREVESYRIAPAEMVARPTAFRPD